MKFLSEEWFDALTVNTRRYFSKPGKLTFKFCEVFECCPGEHETIWALYDIENGMLKSLTHGYGEIPENDYFATGKYADHIRVCKKEIDPKKSVINGTFTVDDHGVGTGPMRILNLINMYMRLVEAMQFDGVDYE